MPEATLALVIVALLTERFLSNRSHDREVVRLTNAVIAKTAGELHLLDEFWAPVAGDSPVRRQPEPSVVPDGFEGQAGLS